MADGNNTPVEQVAPPTELAHPEIREKPTLIIVGIWAVPQTYELRNKSNAADLGKIATPQLHAGDLVAVMQPEQTPLIYYHLPVPGLR